MPSHQAVAERLAAIIAEMQRIGLWQAEPLQPEQHQFKRAFAMDTMTYQQWLQFVFVPRVEAIIAATGAFPDDSQVGIQAIREFDGYTEAEPLVALLCEFDALFDL